MDLLKALKKLKRKNQNKNNEIFVGIFGNVENWKNNKIWNIIIGDTDFNATVSNFQHCYFSFSGYSEDILKEIDTKISNL